MTHPEFSDRPLVAGSIVGVRSFRLEWRGRLAGVSVPDVWLPGENVAECRKDHGSLGYGGVLHQMNITMNRMLYGYRTVTAPLTAGPEPADKPVAEKPPTHRAGDLKCACGFYAYFDNGANPHHHKGNVVGIIEGYGVVTVGSRGFRAEKATIKALVVKPKRLGAQAIDRLQFNYPDVPIFPSKSAALEAHPLTPPPLPTPDTDPEFWTRPVLP